MLLSFCGASHHRRWLVRSRSSPDLQPVIRVLHFSPSSKQASPPHKPPVTSSFSSLHNTLHLQAPFFTAKQISSHFVTAIELSPRSYTISSHVFKKPNKGFRAIRLTQRFLLSSDNHDSFEMCSFFPSSIHVSYGE